MRNKVDANSKAIVAALRAAGASVEMIRSASGGAGVPDLLVGYRGVNYLLEIKVLEGKRDPHPAPLTVDQMEWHVHWHGGAVQVVATPAAALLAIDAIQWKRAR